MENYARSNDDDNLTFRLLEAERALADAESQYQRMADALPYGMWICGPDGELLHISQAFLNLLGMTLEECQQFGWWGKLPPEEVEATKAHWMHSVLNGLPYNREHSVMGRDGVRHHVMVRGVPVRDDMDRVISWIGINLDIDDQKQVEAALRESEKRFRMLADEAPVFIWLSDEYGRFIYFNRQFLSLTGKTLEDHAEEGWLEAVHPDDREAVSRVFQTASAMRSPYEISYRIRAATGEYRILLDRGVPRFREDSQFAGYVGTCTDITELRQAQQAVERANEKYRLTVAAIEALFYDYDVENDVIEYSIGLWNIIGIRGEQAGKNYAWWRDRIHPDDLERVERAFLRPVSQNAMYETEYRVLHADGTYVPVLDRGTWRVGPQGQVVRIIGCTTRIVATRSVMPGSDSIERLRGIVQHSPIASFLTDARGNLDQLNRLAIELMGGDEGLTGTSWPALVHADDRRAVSRDWEAARKEHSRLSTEFRLSNSNSPPIEVQLELSPMRDGNGVLIGYFGVMANISRRKQVMRRLEHSEAMYRTLAEASPSHVFSRMPDGTWDYVNSRWCQYTGLTFEGSLGLGGRRAIHPDDLSPIAPDETGPIEIEQRIRRYDGEYRWFRRLEVPVLGPDGRPVRWICTATDIHQEKLESESRAMRERQLESSLRMRGATMFTMDRDLRYTWISDFRAGNGGVEDLIGKTDWDFLRPEDAEKMDALKRRILETRESVFETATLEVSGRMATYAYFLEPLTDSEANVIGIMGLSLSADGWAAKGFRSVSDSVSTI